MKIRRSIFKTQTLIAGLILIPFLTLGQEEKSATMAKEYNLNTDNELKLSCYDSDLEIKTWSENKVKLTGEITLRGGKSEDRNKVIKAFQ